MLKQNRGNGGQGVWKVEMTSDIVEGASVARVLHAQRGSVPEDTTLAAFMGRCEAYLNADGCIVDQPFQPRLADGMIRCYMGTDKIVGFGHMPDLNIFALPRLPLRDGCGVSILSACNRLVPDQKSLPVLAAEIGRFARRT